MSVIFLIIVIIFIIVPLIKKFKESIDASETRYRNRYGSSNSSNRYGGYNSTNTYNSHNSKKITYDWKPEYKIQNNQDSQGNQNNQYAQSNQGNQGNWSAQSNQSLDTSQTEVNVRTDNNARITPEQVSSIAAAPAANVRPAPASYNRQGSTAAVSSKRASTPSADTRPETATVNINEKKKTVASVRKEINKKEETGQTITDNYGVNVPDMFLEQSIAEMSDYNSIEFSAAAYDVPETDAFKYAEVVVDSNVHVDAVAPGSEIPG